MNRKQTAAIQKLQSKMVEVLTARNSEIKTLHRRVRGQKEAQKFLGTINKRWTALNGLVKKCNEEVVHLRDNWGLKANFAS